MPTIAEAVAVAKARHMIKEAIAEATKPKPRTQRTCAFVRAGGERCAIVALKDHHYCYYHQHDRRDRKELRRLFNTRRDLLEKQSDGAGFGLPNTGAGRAKWDELSALVFDYVDLPALTDATALDAWFTLDGLAKATQQISTARGKALIYAAHVAALILDRTLGELRSAESTAATEPFEESHRNEVLEPADNDGADNDDASSPDASATGSSADPLPRPSDDPIPSASAQDDNSQGGTSQITNHKSQMRNSQIEGESLTGRTRSIPAQSDTS
jgi:hypothetical protein